MELCQDSTVLRMSLAGTLSHLPPHFGLATKLRRAAFGVESVGAVVCQREHLHATHANTFMQVQNPSNRTANSLGLASGTQSTKLEKKVNSCRTFAIKHGIPTAMPQPRTSRVLVETRKSLHSIGGHPSITFFYTQMVYRDVAI
jgi:hypothetical protein